MFLNSVRRFGVGAAIFATLFVLVDGSAAAKSRAKKVSLTAQVKSVNAKKNLASLRYSEKVKVRVHGRSKWRKVTRVVQAQISSRTKLIGGDRTHDGLLGTRDLRRGDRVRVKGTLSGKRLALSDLTDSSSLPRGDRNGDGVPDDVDTTDLLATLVSVNADQHMLTLQITAAPDQPELEGQQILVSLADGGLLSLGDRNHDGARDWNDIQEGDQFALMLIAPVDVDNAQATLAVDLTSLGRKGKDGKHRLNAIPMGGEITAVDPEAGTLTVQPSIAGVYLPEFVLNVSEATRFEVDDVNEDGLQDLNDLQPGDQIKALVATPADPDNLQAVKIISRDHQSGGHGSARLSGQVVSVDAGSQSLDLAVFRGPLAGQTVTMGWDDNTQLDISDANGDGVADWQDVQPGDQMSVVVADVNDLSIAMAWDRGQDDYWNGGDEGQDSGDTPPVPPVLIGTVGSINLWSHNMDVQVQGGELDGQMVTVHLNRETALGTVDNNDDGRANWGDVQAGDNVGVIVDNLDDLNALLVADNGSDPLPEGFGQAGAWGGGESEPEDD